MIMDKKNVKIEFFRNDEPIGFLLRKKGKVVQTTVEGFDPEVVRKISTALSIENSNAMSWNGSRYSWTITPIPDAVPGEPEFAVGDTVHVRETIAACILGTANRTFVIARIWEDKAAGYEWNRWLYFEPNGESHALVDAGAFNAVKHAESVVKMLHAYNSMKVETIT